MKKFIQFMINALLFAPVFANAQYGGIRQYMPKYLNPEVYPGQSGTGGYYNVIYNVSNNDEEIQSDSNTYVRSAFVVSHENDSARNYTVQGAYYVNIKYGNKDTVNFNPALYLPYQQFNLMCTNPGNDTVYLTTTSGRIDSVANEVWGTAPYRARSVIFDGKNFWSINQK